jgi:hypothetical protein
VCDWVAVLAAINSCAMAAIASFTEISLDVGMERRFESSLPDNDTEKDFLV